MAVPWLRLFDAAIGFAQMARSRRAAGSSPDQLEVSSRAIGGLESRLAGVVVAALKEAFDRDSRRLELERQHLEAERRRAERVLKLELLRQAGDREIARLRLLAGVAAVSWIATLLLSPRIVGAATAGRVLLGGGWALLLGAIGLSFAAQASAERALRSISDATDVVATDVPSGAAAQLTPWLIVVGLALVGAAVLSS